MKLIRNETKCEVQDSFRRNVDTCLPEKGVAHTQKEYCVCVCHHQQTSDLMGGGKLKKERVKGRSEEKQRKK